MDMGNLERVINVPWVITKDCTQFMSLSKMKNTKIIFKNAV